MTSVLERLVDAQNDHDAERMASLFAPDYESEQPAHPSRAFTGRDQVLSNWTAVFRGVPDFRARLLASTQEGDTEWAEFDWEGRHTDGTPFAMRGVAIAVIRNGLIASARLYMEPVDHEGGDIEASVEELYKPGGED